MAQLYAGTSGWAYPSWKPEFYPEKLPQKNFLQYYSSQLNTVEVNFTFRQLVKETTVQKWIAETPADFKFGVKAHQVITHIKRLKKTEDFVPRFLSTVAPLAQAGKMGPVLFQLPPNMKADVGVLEEFLQIVPRGVQSAFEFRHDSWFDDEVFDLLKSRNISLCIADTDDLATPRKITADYGYLRLRREDYTSDDVRKWAAFVSEQKSTWKDGFVYFKHEESGMGPKLAKEMLDILAG